jgi:hypothetical protein
MKQHASTGDRHALNNILSVSSCNADAYSRKNGCSPHSIRLRLEEMVQDYSLLRELLNAALLEEASGSGANVSTGCDAIVSPPRTRRTEGITHHLILR